MKVWVDANPSYVCLVAENGVEIIKELPTNRSWTNNEAEYMAIITALKAYYGPIFVNEILSDSQLVVRQLNGDYAIREERLRELANQVWKLAQGKVKFTWVPRHENKAGRLLG